MNITDVRIRRVPGPSRTKATASVTLEGEFVVHEVRVVEGRDGLFVSMPSRRMQDGEFRDIAHPITATAREQIQAAVLGAYEKRDERERADRVAEV
jgi:stage V sporulation protein G